MMTGITFLQINVQFLLLYVTLSNLITMKTMGFLEKKIKNEFYYASLHPVP